MKEQWFTIENIEYVEDDCELYCIAVDSPEHQFLIGEQGIPTHNTDEAKAVDELKGEAIMIIGSIARLGRASGVHLVIATQRPDASLIPGEVRDNLAVRIGCGPLKPSASTMLFASNVGQKIHSNPKGGIYVQIHGRGNMGQGFYAPDTWLTEYFKKHKQVKPNNGIDDLDSLDEQAEKTRRENPLESWDDDMDDLISAHEPEEDEDDFKIEETDEYGE